MRVPGRLRRRLGSSPARDCRPARPTDLQDGPGGDGGPRSTIAWSPRSLRDRVLPEVRLETPPRMAAGRATASGHRAELRHEATLREERERPKGSDEEDRRGAGEVDRPSGSHRQRVVPVHQVPCVAHRRAPAWEEYDIVPTVEANGNKPISPLSVAAEPRCA